MADASHFMYLNFHTNTGGALALSGPGAVGAVGGSKVVIHPVLRAGACPTISRSAVKDTYEYPCGSCTNARFAVDDYALKVAGPWAVAIHVIDGLGAAEAPAQVGSLNDDDYDPAPKQNGGVVGAAVYRWSRQSYVVASSGLDGQVAGGTMTYAVPGGSASRHVVFDAPEDGSGRSLVSATASSGRCVVSITAGAGFAGRPLLFSVGTAVGGCALAEDANVVPGDPPPGTGASPISGCSSGNAGGGCSAASPVGSKAPLASFLGLCVAAALLLRRRAIGQRSGR